MNNNNVSSWTRVVIEIGILLFAVGIAWALLNGDVKNNKEKVDLAVKKISTCAESVSIIKSDIREIKVEQKYISQGIDEIKKELKMRQGYGK